jgi:lipopolysaccharide export system ATP-binding protein
MGALGSFLSRLSGRRSSETAAPKPAVRTDPEKLKGTLIARGLTKSYKGRQVVSGVSFGIRAGEAVGLLGPNGAGKTTCFYMVTGLVPVDHGTIEIDGHDVTTLPMYRRARLGVGYLPQEASIFRGLTVEDNIRAVLEVHDENVDRRESKLNDLLGEFSITHLRKSPAIALSGGERRRLEIARALATDPTFMLLDEPFAGVDPISVADIQALVRHLTSRGIGVLITDHNVRDTLAIIDRAYILAEGVVISNAGQGRIVSAIEVAMAGYMTLPPELGSLMQQEPVAEGRLVRLTSRQHLVLAKLARGLGNRQLANELGVDELQVQATVRAILARLRLPNRTRAALFAIEHGLVSLDPPEDPDCS